MTVTLVEPYNSEWPFWFEKIKCFVEPALANIPHEIEHIGSTAIPGMTAKPIIDIDIIIEKEQFMDVKNGLEKLNYSHRGDLGIPDREAFELQDIDAKARLPAHHLYVANRDCQALCDHIVFRDFMRVNPKWIRKLSDLKWSLCQQHRNDRQAYMDGKSEMVREITELAWRMHND